MAREGKYAQVRLASGEMRLVLAVCRATIGQVGNADHENISIGKAGRVAMVRETPTGTWGGDESCGSSTWWRRGQDVGWTPSGYAVGRADEGIQNAAQ